MAAKSTFFLYYSLNYFDYNDYVITECSAFERNEIINMSYVKKKKKTSTSCDS